MKTAPLESTEQADVGFGQMNAWSGNEDGQSDRWSQPANWVDGSNEQTASIGRDAIVTRLFCGRS